MSFQAIDILVALGVIFYPWFYFICRNPVCYEKHSDAMLFTTFQIIRLSIWFVNWPIACKKKWPEREKHDQWFTLVCTFHENVMRFSKHSRILAICMEKINYHIYIVRFRHALAHSHTPARSHMHYIRNGHDAKQPKKNPSKHDVNDVCEMRTLLLNLDFIWEKWLRQMNKYIIGWWHVRRAHTKSDEWNVCVPFTDAVPAVSEWEWEKKERKLGDDEKWS